MSTYIHTYVGTCVCAGIRKERVFIENKMFDKDGKAGFEDISRSLKRSRVRCEIMMYLYNRLVAK